MIDAAACGNLLRKTAEEWYELLEEMVASSYHPQSERNNQRKNAEVHQVTEFSAIIAQLDVLNRKLYGLNMGGTAMRLQEIFCEKCGGEHFVKDCQDGNPFYMQEETPVNQVGVQNRPRNDLYSNTYNPGWRQHPNFSWGGQNNTDTRLQNQDASIKGLENQIGQLARMIESREPGTLPSNTETNPKEQVKAIELKSVKILESRGTKKIKKLGLGEPKPTRMSLQLADKSVKYPRGVVEDVLVKVDKFTFPADFVVLDMEEDIEMPLILGRPFLAIGNALIDVQEGKLRLRVGEEEITYDVFNALKHTLHSDSCFRIDAFDSLVSNYVQDAIRDPFEATLTTELREDKLDEEKAEIVAYFNANHPWRKPIRMGLEDLGERRDLTPPKSSIEEPPTLELKPLPPHLQYMLVLKEHKKAFSWKLADIKGISPSIYMHKILMEEKYSPLVQPQRRLNPKMQEVVKAETIKLLDAGIIYPISDSAWVSHVQCVPKKGWITVITNEKNELIPTSTVTGWRVCMDYRKLNDGTRKDHFPLPFIDQMLERLAGHEFYCFLDGYLGYNQITIAPEDQEKTTFTCPYGTFGFRRMPFGLCNAPAIFLRCMTAIFHDIIETFLEIFMDDFFIFGATFDECLQNLRSVLRRCEETNLVLNWEKCHFMVQDGIVLGHKISEHGIEVDKAKVEVIKNLPPPTSIKGVRNFLGHTGFYRRFIKDFSKIAKPLSSLLMKNVPFDFNYNCLQAYEADLKKLMLTAPVFVAPDWDLPFEVMCDESDTAVGAVLGQRKNKMQSEP
ncbi:uncharacterized protein [Primulina huaijiensis]|uniref:uncharacterized protein n=1 Tax=Primulina huaijiensis TaxID=1492673 RepID=UPI003CC7609F